VFSVRFLVVNAPFHLEYLVSVTDKFCAENLGGKELWSWASQFLTWRWYEDLLLSVSCPTNSCFVGSDMRKLLTSMMCSLCDQNFTSLFNGPWG
jgi:fatty acid synthase subunit beta